MRPLSCKSEFDSTELGITPRASDGHVLIHQITRLVVTMDRIATMREQLSQSVHSSEVTVDVRLTQDTF